MSRSRAGISFMRRVSINRSPEVIFSSPATIRMVEDLPQPDGPSRQRNSPSRHVSDRSHTACTWPYFFQTWRSSTVAMVLLHCAEGETADEMALQQHRQDKYRDNTHRGGRHEGAPADAHGRRESGDRYRQRPHVVRCQDCCEQKFVPCENG